MPDPKNYKKPTNSGNPWIKCPFCERSMDGRNLAKHVKLFHANDTKPTSQGHNPQNTPLGGIEIESPDLIQEIKRFVIDEDGFLVLPDSLAETKPEGISNGYFHQTESLHSKKQSHVFDDIQSTGPKRPSANMKKLRPLPGEEVVCPICNEVLLYMYLFNHVNYFHKEKVAKLVLAEFNREYDKAAQRKQNKT
jgi:hypothetical protein